jgi:flagellar protein FlaG
MSISFLIQPPEFDARLAQASEKPSGKPKYEEKSQPPSNEPARKDERQHLQNVLAEQDISLKFRVDEKTGQLVVEMIDNKTGDAVRQMPSEVSLKLSEAFAKVQGQFIEVRV